MAVLLGTNAKEATWLNPSISAAKSQRVRIEVEHQQALYEVQEQLAQAQKEAEIEALQRERAQLEAQQQRELQALNQEIKHREVAFQNGMTVLAFSGSAASIAIIIGSLLWFSTRASKVMRTDKPLTMIQTNNNLWTSPHYRQDVIRQARKNERDYRALIKGDQVKRD